MLMLIDLSETPSKNSHSKYNQEGSMFLQPLQLSNEEQSNQFQFSSNMPRSHSACSSYSENSDKDSFVDFEWNDASIAITTNSGFQPGRYCNIPGSVTVNPTVTQSSRYYSPVTPHDDANELYSNIGTKLDDSQRNHLRQSCPMLNNLGHHEGIGHSKIEPKVSPVKTQWEAAYKKNPQEFIQRRDKAFDWLNDTVVALSLDTPTRMTWPKIQKLEVAVASSASFAGGDRLVAQIPNQSMDLAVPCNDKVTGVLGTRSFPPPTTLNGSLFPNSSSHQQNALPHPISENLRSWPHTQNPCHVRSQPVPPLPACPPNTAQVRPVLMVQPQVNSKTVSQSPVLVDSNWSELTGLRPVGSAFNQPFKTSSESSAPQRKPEYYEEALQLQQRVNGATISQCLSALQQTTGDETLAECNVKVDLLYGLGLSSRDHCKKILNAADWNLERAGSILLDDMNYKIS